MTTFDEQQRVVRLGAALSDPKRVAILEHLRTHPGALVQELGEVVELSQPTVSFHLGKLRAVGLITSADEGRYHRQHLVPDAFEQAGNLVAGIAGAV